MEADNFDLTLNAFKRRSPFRPFTVVLVNGDRFEVDYPGALVVRDGVAIFIAAGGIPRIFSITRASTNFRRSDGPGEPLTTSAVPCTRAACDLGLGHYVTPRLLAASAERLHPGRGG